MKRGERKTHCPHGHEYSPENTYLTKGREGRGAKVCRQCLFDRRARGQDKAATLKRYRAWRKHAITVGLCPFCRSPAGVTTQLCDKHAEMRRAKRSVERKQKQEQRTALAKERQSSGLCSKCEGDIPEAICEKHWPASQKTRHRAQIKAWRDAHPERYRKLRNEWRQNRKAADHSFWVMENCRRRITKAIQDYAPGKKSAATMRLIGCSLENLMNHLESLFLPGMSWENRSRWHIDHKTPCAAFNLADPEQQKACFHYTNLQPLWAQDNIRKHAKIQNIGESLCVS